MHHLGEAVGLTLFLATLSTKKNDMGPHPWRPQIGIAGYDKFKEYKMRTAISR